MPTQPNLHGLIISPSPGPDKPGGRPRDLLTIPIESFNIWFWYALEHQQLRATTATLVAKRPALRTAGRRAAVFALLVLVFSGSAIVFHDYFCQEHDEHIHEICSPLHVAYVNSEPFAAEAAFGGCQPRALQPITAQGFPLSGFTANIFHPPDLSA
jgi:hypothetical protein